FLSAFSRDTVSLIALLPCHCDVKSLFGCDEVVVAIRSQVNLHPFDLPGEFACFRSVVRGHVGASVMTNVACLVGREDHRLGTLDATLASLLTIIVESYF